MTTTVRPGEVAGAALTAPERPAEAVELCELLYRGIFSSGLLVIAIMSAYAGLLSAIRPEGNRLTGVLVSLALIAICAVALAFRAQCYRFLRRRPWAIAVPALIVGGAAWIIGDPNDQIFYVITLTLGVTGLTVRFSYVLAATAFAGLGCTAPALMSSAPHVTSTAIAAVTIPTIFWLIIEQLARYILRAYGEGPSTAGSSAGATDGQGPSGVQGHSKPGAARATQRPTLRGRLQRLLPARLGPRERPVTLSARQLEVVLLCAEGLSHGEIGACLEIGPQQVRRHLREARSRTDSTTTAALMAWTVRRRLIPRAASLGN